MCSLVSGFHLASCFSGLPHFYSISWMQHMCRPVHMSKEPAWGSHSPRGLSQRQFSEKILYSHTSSHQLTVSPLPAMFHLLPLGNGENQGPSSVFRLTQILACGSSIPVRTIQPCGGTPPLIPCCCNCASQGYLSPSGSKGVPHILTEKI